MNSVQRDAAPSSDLAMLETKTIQSGMSFDEDVTVFLKGPQANRRIATRPQ